jgi:hypothetical protein
MRRAAAAYPLARQLAFVKANQCGFRLAWNEEEEEAL